MGNLTDFFASGGGSNVLEILSSPCDGRTVTVSSGTYTMQNVTNFQQPASSYVDYEGSVINYLPPAGTKRVIYEFNTNIGWHSTHAISSFKIFIGGTEVTAARMGVGGQYNEAINSIKWTFEIGDTADAANGVVTSWDTAKELKVQARNYGSSNDNKLNATRYQGTGSAAYFVRPVLTITALS